ncbi:CoA transferase [Ramlibacter alkalitolerans]|uniref:CoA transferase n=1 Tax=Ramlibacter alkalitolerans TaxID=2039631 RepID=A0ABS1JLB1_9BURK|nr:CoA transferase [Ramlibacter alkalitolerans]MBL0425017.1 CoA transferase [Ramlibacter alkalitolerans]
MTRSFAPLHGIRILSLALNLPGPAALMRCRRLGASCTKLEPPSGDPMGHYDRAAYAQLHEGVKVLQADLKTSEGQQVLQRELARSDILLTSFRPSAIAKLGLGWKELHTRHPTLSQVAIVGAPGARAEEPGHDLTYLADNGLVPGLELPATLYADMGGSLMASEAVLQAALRKHERYAGEGDPHPEGLYLEVALSDAAAWLALPRRWGLTQPAGSVGGAHAGYRVYACKDGRAAVAALEPHFARRLCEAAGVSGSDVKALFAPGTHEAVAAFFAARTCEELDRLATEQDLPIHAMRA